MKRPAWSGWLRPVWLVRWPWSSSQAVEELSEKTTISDLFAALVRHLAGEFSRVALFRLKANRLEGEDQIGFDQTTDVTKLVLPLNVDSLITRAASSGSFEHLVGNELDENGRAPFGGTPTVALAMPITFQGETLAVEDGGFADAAIFGQHGANLCGCRRVDQRAGDEAQLHAEAIGALLQNDDRAKRSQFLSIGFQDTTPQRAQTLDRTGAAEIDAEIGVRHRDIGRWR